MNFEQIILVLTTLGIREVAGQLIAWFRGGRGEKRDDVRELWKENRELRKEIETLSNRLQETHTEMVQLKGLYHNITQWSDLNCPYDGERCPLRLFFRTHAQSLESRGDGVIKGGKDG